jgi:hypothetical protein
MDYKQKVGSRGIASALIFVAWCLLYFDGLWGYTQTLTLGQKKLPSSILVLILGAYLIAKLKGEKNDRLALTIAKTSYLWACWMTCVLLIASQESFSNPFRIAFGFYVNNWPTFLIIPALLATLQIEARLAKIVLVAFSIPTLALGVAQGISQDNFEIGRKIAADAASFNLGFYGQRRANSVFGHAEDLGYFGSVASSVALTYLISSKSLTNKLWALILLTLSLLATYYTLTRATYIATAFSLTTVLILEYSRSNPKAMKLVTYLPGIYALTAAIVFFGAPLLRILDSGLLSTASLGDRFYGNAYYLQEIGKDGWLNYFTGLGWFVGGHHRAFFAIDNQYLGLLLSSGFVGLLFWLAVTIMIWRWLILAYIANPSPLMHGIVAGCSTWLAIAFFNVSNTFPLFAIAGVLVGHSRNETATRP